METMIATVSSIITRGQVWLADLGTPTGSEQGGVRPVLVVQNDVGNRFSPTILVSPLTSSKSKRNLPTHVILRNTTFLPEVSTALIEQMRSIDRGRLIKMLGRTNDNIMIEIDEAIRVQTALKKQLDWQYAFDLIRQIQNIKGEIHELGKRPRLISMLQYQVDTFKTYCADCNTDYNTVLEEFNNQKHKNVL
jgi:mRNA interferase MazF